MMIRIIKKYKLFLVSVYNAFFARFCNACVIHLNSHLPSRAFVTRVLKSCKYVTISSFFIITGCESSDPDYGFAKDNPNSMVGNWIVFEVPQGDFEGWGFEDYQLVTAVDPNRDSTLVINNLYNSNIRVRVPYSQNEFDEKFVQQIDTIDGFDYNIHYVSLDGEVSQSYYVAQLSYQYALASFPDMDFDFDGIEDVIYINAGFYDFDSLLVDSVVILGYRKTGFEDVPID